MQGDYSIPGGEIERTEPSDFGGNLTRKVTIKWGTLLAINPPKPGASRSARKQQ
jgi:hypothetical protein